jgi:hypothetical protein
MAFLIVTYVNSSYAYAASTTVTSSYAYETENGYNYYFYSYATSFDSSSIYGLVKCMSNGSGNIPIGYMGVHARLYDKNTTLITSSDWYYNQNAVAGIGATTSFIYTSGTYYSKGEVDLYNGNSYTGYEAYGTPYLSIGGSRASLSLDASNNIKVNKNGETYGSELIADTMGIKLDLIAARGINNIFGYVRSSDLNSTKIDNPNDITPLKSKRTIPLYNEDGVAIIDSFVIDNTGIETVTN